MKRLMSSFAAVAALAAGGFVWYAWWTAYPAGVQALNPEADVPAVRLSFDPSVPQTLALPSGTTFRIPADAFVAPDGSAPVTADLVVREFMSASDLLRAGIPMQLEPGGTRHLVSAGMLEVRAESGSTPLALRPGAALDVALASNLPADDGFRLWALDDAGTWTDAGTFDSAPNTPRDSALAAIDSALAAPEARADARARARRARKGRSDWSFELQPDAEGSPHLLPWAGVVWDWLPDGPDDSPPAAALRGDWTDARVEPRKDGTYRITLTFERARYDGEIVRATEVVRAEPRLNGRQRKRTEEAYAEASTAWEAKQAALREERLFYAMQRAFLHRFSLQNLGYINLDKLEDAATLPAVALHFDFEQGARFMDKTMLYLVDRERSTVLTFLAADWGQIPVPAGPVYLVALLDTAHAAVVDPVAFEAHVRSRARPRPFTTELTVPTRSMAVEEALALIGT